MRKTPVRNVMPIVLWWSAATFAAPLVDSMRGPTPLPDEPHPPPLSNPENKDVRRNRAFAMQPPTIPHKIDGYQVDRNANRCVSCHARTRIEESKAIAIPATHYLDRDGTMRGDISPRRYFCTQCHVAQDEVKPLVDNTYQDFDALAKSPRKGGPAPAGKK
jgi:cytochrome c-type protein NapB